MKNIARIIFALLLIFTSCSKSSDGDKDIEPIEYTLTISITPDDSGSVNPTSASYDSGVELSIEASPLNGYFFKEWTGSVQSTVNPVSVTMNSNKNIIAVFEKLDTDQDGVIDDLDQCPDTPTGSTVNEIGCPAAGLFLDQNGVTIKCDESSNIGDTAVINGINYVIVDESILRQMVNDDEDVTTVCTCKITDMNRLFQNKTEFNQDIGSWDVSLVTNTSYMFENTSFNADISSWDISNVTTMYYMFKDSPFNQPIGEWNVGNVTTMYGLFQNTPFNQTIGKWNVSSVTNMGDMFLATPFNQSIADWDVSNVITMFRMFYRSEFNQPIGEWNVGNVIMMFGMFWDSQFNQPIANWNVGSVAEMSSMFESSMFNQDIGSWNVANVEDMTEMFSESVFNKSLENWNVGNVTSMYRMFKNSSFDQPIASWNVESVTNMSEMFSSSIFNQDLSSWNVDRVNNCIGFNSNTMQWTLPKPNFTNCTP